MANTKVITLANHKGHRLHWSNQNAQQIYVADAKRGKTCASNRRWILAFWLDEKVVLVFWANHEAYWNNTKTNAFYFRLATENCSNMFVEPYSLQSNIKALHVWHKGLMAWWPNGLPRVELQIEWSGFKAQPVSLCCGVELDTELSLSLQSWAKFLGQAEIANLAVR